ncbi:hypothetical protein JOC78_001017 [Bacillus ectoiniformans]|uniref:hypothetical protein n=1 Tax=Bacillus ectoiniformans TaxID=1494429 RepID=UPI001959F604|nr:hypothetical protein [Bacillus ectoiniformans]MBM7648077.1 hypothetical protein [Bacillus ectoiniformans]
MSKSNITKLSLTFLLCYFSINNYVVEAMEKESVPLEEQYKGSGYTTPVKAINKFEQVHKNKLNIPDNFNKLLPFKVTHKFGQYEGKEDQHLRIEYLNEKSLANFVIMVFPVEKGISLSQKEQVSTMNDGTLFSYMKNDGFYIFRFKTNDWSYVLSTNHLGENANMTEENFIRIAEHLKNSN